MICNIVLTFTIYLSTGERLPRIKWISESQIPIYFYTMDRFTEENSFDVKFMDVAASKVPSYDCAKGPK